MPSTMAKTWQSREAGSRTWRRVQETSDEFVHRRRVHDQRQIGVAGLHQPSAPAPTPRGGREAPVHPRPVSRVPARSFPRRSEPARTSVGLGREGVDERQARRGPTWLRGRGDRHGAEEVGSAPRPRRGSNARPASSVPSPGVLWPGHPPTGGGHAMRFLRLALDRRRAAGAFVVIGREVTEAIREPQDRDGGHRGR